MRWALAILAAALVGGCATGRVVDDQRLVERAVGYHAIEHDPATIAQRERTVSEDERAKAERRKAVQKANAATEALRAKLKDSAAKRVIDDYMDLDKNRHRN